MPTYAENQAARERKQRNAAQDQVLRRQTAEFDLSAQDKHMKYERLSFTVVTASEAFRDGWDRIFTRNTDEPQPTEVAVEHSDRHGSAR